LRAEPGEQEREREDRDDDDDREGGHGAESVDEVGAREPEPLLEPIPEPSPLDENARHREPEEREPGKRDEVDAREDEHARRCERQEGDRADEERPTSRVPGIGRDRDGPDVAERERERPEHDSVRHTRAALEERRADREGCRRDAEPEPAPEPVPVELDRLGDQLADGPLGRRDLSRSRRHCRDRTAVPRFGEL
jgi:hypothetical protein